MTTIKEIDITIYPVSVFVVCTDSYWQILSKVNAHFKRVCPSGEPFSNINVPDQDRCTAFVISSGTFIYIVLPFNKEETNRSCQLHFIPTLNGITAHEALHVTSVIMDLVGIRFDRNNDEPIAYLVGHIAEKATISFLDFLYKLNLGPYIYSHKDHPPKPIRKPRVK